MTFPTVPFDDVARVAALRRYGVLDDARLGDLEAVTRVAATLCEAPTAMVNLIDAERAVMPCTVGDPPGEYPRSFTLCEPVIRAGTLIHLENLGDDPRWADCYAVQGDDPLVRMYASAPLVTPDGHTVGTLCVMDRRRRRLGPETLKALQDLADTVVQLFESRLQATKLQSALAELTLQASLDALTGVGNRSQLLDILDEYQCSGVAHTVLFCDLDRFKPVNDTHGHAVGDQVLAAVGARLRAAARGEDFVARLGGDEFVVVVPGENEATAAAMASRVRSLVGDPIVTTAGEMTVGVSVGWSTSSSGFDCLARADAAMYEAKRRRSAAAV